jgi:hypothetical protein
VPALNFLALRILAIYIARGFMPGALDIVSRLRTELPAAKVPISTVASLANLSGSKVTAYVNGVLSCPGNHNQILNDTWRDLQSLIRAVSPLVLDYRRVDALRTAIKLMHEGRLHVSVFDPTIAPTEWHQQQSDGTNPLSTDGISTTGYDYVGRPKESLS